ncbi:radical SAM protein [Finegoldia magna]|uniref:radical SAM/SPASM domain-containing protein n=1 Tax=Finegoldia magna TaxID=1260 RepID=UPI0032C1C806
MYIKELELYQSDRNKSFVFSCRDLNFYILEQNYTNELQRIVEGEKPSDEKVSQELKSINSIEKNDKIDSLKLIVSNTCNMNCKYCYADGGNYGRKNDLMGENVANKVIEFVKNNDIKNICFFGGEPLLAFDTIKFICNNLKDKVNYLIQTNGTILNDEIIKLLKKYNFDVTVSIDGNKKINDENRIFKDGKGTYDVISKNIDKMLDNDINISVLEGTITKHTNRIESFSNIEKFLKNRFKGPLVQLEKDINDSNIYDDRDKYYSGSIEEIVENFKQGKILDLGYYKDPIDHIISKKYESYFCGAGTEQITIDTNGDIYICPLFIKKNRDKKKLNIMNDRSVNLNLSSKQYKKSFNKNCDKCIARFNCKRCIATNSTINEENCATKRKSTELAIEYIMGLIENNQYNNFVQDYIKFSGRFI